jgi:hypothetical protein
LELLCETILAVLFACEIKSQIDGKDVCVHVVFAQTEYISVFTAVEVHGLVMTIVEQSQAAMMTMFKSMMTAIIMNGRDLRIPESTSAKTQCHKAAIKVLLNIARSCEAITSKWSMVDSSDSNEEVTMSMVPTAPNTPDKPVQEKSATQSTSLTMPYAGIVGILQRLTLCAPDRVNTRAIAAESIVSVIAALHRADSTAGQEGSVLILKLSDKEKLSIQQYFNFLLKLSVCNKVGLRAFAMEIISGILVTEWVWANTSEEGINAEVAITLPRALLLTLVERCVIFRYLTLNLSLTFLFLFTDAAIWLQLFEFEL